METTLRDFKHWMCSDRIMLNDDETKCIVIASRHLLEKAAVNTISPKWGIWVRDFITILIWQYTLLDYAVLLSSDCIALGASENTFSGCSFDSYSLFGW